MKRRWDHEELCKMFSLSTEDRELLRNKSGATRLGFAVLLKVFQSDGKFPAHRGQVPDMVLSGLVAWIHRDAHCPTSHPSFS